MYGPLEGRGARGRSASGAPRRSSGGGVAHGGVARAQRAPSQPQDVCQALEESPERPGCRAAEVGPSRAALRKRRASGKHTSELTPAPSRRSPSEAAFLNVKYSDEIASPAERRDEARAGRSEERRV